MYEDILEREWNVHSVVQSSNLEYETVTRGSPYDFAMLNSTETRHLGKTLIISNW